MSVDQAAFAEFREALKAPPTPVDDGLSDAQRLARARETFFARVDRRAAVDLDTCIHCGMCAEACHFYMATEDERYTPTYKFAPLRRFYRREVSPLRWFYKPFTRKLRLADLQDWYELVYEACTGCGRCDMMCPMGINISSMIGIMRQGLASAGLAPAELRALAAEQTDDNALFGVGAAELTALVDKLRGQGVELPFDREGADVLVLTTAVEVRLFPDSLKAVARILDKAGVNWTLSSTAFEAANIGLISGDQKARHAAMRRIVDVAKACGAGCVVVPESGHAYQALRWEAANELDEELPFDVYAIAEYAAELINDGKVKLKATADPKTLTYHDPCRLGRHGGVFEAPRELLAEAGHHVRDPEANRRENVCCGGGCGEYTISHGAALRQKAFDFKRHELDATGAQAVVTGCANCRINFMLGAANSGWDKPILSLVETVAENLAD